MPYKSLFPLKPTESKKISIFHTDTFQWGRGRSSPNSNCLENKTISVTLQNSPCIIHRSQKAEANPTPTREEGDLRFHSSRMISHYGYPCNARFQKHPHTAIFSGQWGEISSGTLLPFSFQDDFHFFLHLVSSISCTHTSVTSAHLRLWKQRALSSIDENVEQSPTHSNCMKNIR